MLAVSARGSTGSILIGWMPRAGFEPQRARRASGVAGSQPAKAGRPEQDSNLSEPGGRAVSQVRSLRRLDAPSRIRTSASPEGERCRRFAACEGWTPRAGFEPSEPGGRAVSQVRCLRRLDAPSRIRTCDLLLRRESLYPAELSGPGARVALATPPRRAARPPAPSPCGRRGE